MKMKAKIKFIALGAAIVALGACSSDDEAVAIMPSTMPADSVIRITTNVNNLVATRATEGATNYTGDALGLYIKPTAATSGWTNVPTDPTNKYIYANITFVKNGDDWTPDSAGLGKMLWKGADVEYEYHAFAPADRGAAANGDSTLIDLTGQKDSIKTMKDSLKYDLLYATKTDIVSNLLVNGKLPIGLDHKMCKVKICLDSIGDEFYQDGTDNPIDSIVITTSNIKIGMNVLTGEVTGKGVSGELAYDMTKAHHTAGTKTTPGKFETTELFYPPVSEKFTIKIWTKDGRFFKYTHPQSFSFDSGKVYTITLKMGKDVIQGDAGISATAWQTATDKSVETE